MTNEAQMREQCRFGDLIENIAASEYNPIKRGYFISRGRKTGRMNPGPYIEYVDTVLGRKHKTPPDNVRLISRHQSATNKYKPLVEALGRIKLLCATTDGWPEGETFYKGVIESIREELKATPND